MEQSLELNRLQDSTHHTLVQVTGLGNHGCDEALSVQSRASCSKWFLMDLTSQPLSWGDAYMHTRWRNVRVRTWPCVQDSATAHRKELCKTALFLLVDFFKDFK